MAVPDGKAKWAEGRVTFPGIEVSVTRRFRFLPVTGGCGAESAGGSQKVSKVYGSLLKSSLYFQQALEEKRVPNFVSMSVVGEAATVRKNSSWTT